VTTVLLCLAIGLAATSAVFLGLLFRAERQVGDRDAELETLRELLANTREDAAHYRKQLIAVTKERDQFRRDAYLHETWTIGGGGAWAA
jgi:uncharacterized protein (DUF3084 family)